MFAFRGKGRRKEKRFDIRKQKRKGKRRSDLEGEKRGIETEQRGRKKWME